MKHQPSLRLPLLLLGIAALLQAADSPHIFSEIGTIQAGLSSITGLRFTHNVPYGILTKYQLRAFLEEPIKKALRPADFPSDKFTLKMLVLIPPDSDPP